MQKKTIKKAPLLKELMYWFSEFGFMFGDNHFICMLSFCFKAYSVLALSNILNEFSERLSLQRSLNV